MKSVTILCFAAFIVAACGSSGWEDLTTEDSITTSGEVGPFVETSNIRLAGRTFQDAASGSPEYGIRFDVKRIDTDEYLKVGAGDSLSITLDDVPQPIEEIYIRTCDNIGISCRYYLRYRVDFQEDPAGKTLAFSLERQTGVNQKTTIPYPARPTIIEPTPGTRFSMSTDTINVSWQPEDFELQARLAVTGRCLLSSDHETVEDSTGMFSYSPARLLISNHCENETEIEINLGLHRTFQDSFLTLASDGDSVDLVLRQ